jgi:hypothetical protein
MRRVAFCSGSKEAKRDAATDPPKVISQRLSPDRLNLPDNGRKHRTEDTVSTEDVLDQVVSMHWESLIAVECCT